jgi:tRNA (guanine-N7-)-methyltransferase
MRLRNVKNKQEIMDSSNYLIMNPFDYIGKWNTVFGNCNPIHLEIGTGKGNFIIGKALNNPDINFIGIEKFDSVIARCLEKIPDGLPNLKIIRMNALEIDKVFKKEIATIYLNFSDPWPKKRWYKRRLTSSIFLDKYDSLFQNDACIIQKTDNTELFEYSICSLSMNGYTITDISFDLHHSEIKDNIMTEYEEKFSKKGNPIYYLVAVKKENI